MILLLPAYETGALPYKLLNQNGVSLPLTQYIPQADQTSRLYLMCIHRCLPLPQPGNFPQESMAFCPNLALQVLRPQLVLAEGIEPPYAAYKTAALPLDDASIIGAGNENRTHIAKAEGF